MSALAFDTLKFTKHMVAAGMPAEQAEALAEEQSNLVNEQLATKRDIELMRRDIKALEASTKHDIKELEVSLLHKMAEAKTELIKWMFAAITAQTLIVIGIIKFLQLPNPLTP